MRTVVAAFALLMEGSLAPAQAPVKLDLQANWHRMRAGTQVPVHLRLLDSTNHLAKAPHRLEILLQGRLPSGEVKPLRTVELAAGQSEKDLTVTPPGSGMVYLWARHSELLPGGEFVAVTGGPQRTPEMGLKRPLPRLALRFSPDRRFLADGKDSATVQAFLLTEPSGIAGDLRLKLFDSSGTMQPVPLTIQKGQDSARAQLTYNRPGKVTVEFLGSTPPAEIEGDRKVQIAFMPPIARVTLEASPPAISLVDTADLVVTLADDQGRPVASDAARRVTLAIQTGRGEITRKELDIPAGQFQARTTFEPSWLGRTSIMAATPNLLTVTAPVDVSAPIGLLLLSLAGGLTGGYLSYLKQKRSGRRRIGIGAVTGFLFYWLCLFVGLAAIGRGVVINPLSAYALSTLGGWMQTEVFSLLKARVKAKA
ncbi:MAG: hypothetical protein C5B51_29505 [Terriglobia bacterium]|nr:MAG: hypothetical protein C5B51_29505 [Terriglobia bacterium]